MRSHVHPDHVEREARRAAGRKFGFAVHATVYVLVNLAIAGSATLAGRPLLAAVPLAGWGLGLLIHGLAALGPLGALRRRLLERELERMGRGRRA